MRTLVLPPDGGRKEPPSIRTSEGIFRLREGELLFDYRDFTNRPQRGWKREQIVDVFVTPLEGARGMLTLKMADGSLEQFGRQSSHRAGMSAGELRKLLGFEPQVHPTLGREEAPSVRVESSDGGTTITSLFCASPSAPASLIGGGFAALLMMVWISVAVTNAIGPRDHDRAAMIFLPVPAVGMLVSLSFVMYGLKHRGDRMRVRVAGGQLEMITASRNGAVVKSLTLPVAEVTGVNVHMTQRGKGGPVFGLHIHRNDGQPELILSGVEERSLEELSDALHAALKLESREENAQRWLGTPADSQIQDEDRTLPYQPEASEEQILLRTPGRLKVMIPPLRLDDLKQKQGFGIACTIIAFVLVWTCVFVFIAHTYLPCVLLSIGACVAAYAMRDLVAHVTLEVSANELSRDVRPLWFGRIVRRFDAGSIREIVVIPHSAQVAVHIGTRAERLAFMRTPAEAEELAGKLRAALGLVRSA